MNTTYKQFKNNYAKAVANLQKQWQTEAITYGFVADSEDEIFCLCKYILQAFSSIQQKKEKEAVKNINFVI